MPARGMKRDPSPADILFDAVGAIVADPKKYKKMLAELDARRVAAEEAEAEARDVEDKAVAARKSLEQTEKKAEAANEKRVAKLIAEQAKNAAEDRALIDGHDALALRNKNLTRREDEADKADDLQSDGWSRLNTAQNALKADQKSHAEACQALEAREAQLRSRTQDVERWRREAETILKSVPAID